jgi:hypothetical protein
MRDDGQATGGGRPAWCGEQERHEHGEDQRRSESSSSRTESASRPAHDAASSGRSHRSIP